MGVAIRQYDLANDRVRLSLDIYHGGRSKFENLNLFLYKKPKTLLDREHNKKTSAIAESIKAKRILEIQEHRYNIKTGFKSKASFLSYFKKMADTKTQSVGNFEVWACVYKVLKKFANGRDMTFEDMNEQVLMQFKEYLLTGRVMKGRRNLAKNSASAYLCKVKAALNCAFNENIITENPTKRVKNIKNVEVRKQFLLAEELKMLTDTECPTPVIKKAFLFGCLTGLRWSDINKLVWQEIVYSEAESIYKINFTQKKTKGIEYHPISAQAFKMLGKRGANDERIFKGLNYSSWYNTVCQMLSF